MSNAAFLFPELVRKDDGPEEITPVLPSECRQHIWLKPEGDADPNIVAKCKRCGMTMVRRPVRKSSRLSAPEDARASGDRTSVPSLW